MLNRNGDPIPGYKPPPQYHVTLLIERWPRMFGKRSSAHFAHGMLQALTRSKPNGRERAESWTWSIAGRICAAPTSKPAIVIPAIHPTRPIAFTIFRGMHQARYSAYMPSRRPVGM